MARNGDYAVVVNSIANEVVVMSVGEDGVLREASRTNSGGLNPYDVAVALTTSWSSPTAIRIKSPHSTSIVVDS
jgi:hypothetical protein